MSVKEVRKLVARFIKGYSIRNPEKHPFIMSIKTKAEKQFIGICGFGPKEELGGEAEIAYFIDEAHSNQGYMSQVVERAIDYYFSMTNKPYLSALVDELNIPSYKLLRKNGFEFYPVEDESKTIKSHYRRYRA